MAEDQRTWREQYDLLFKILMDENTRYWTRFNVSLLINGGLIVAFSSFIGYVLQSSDVWFGLVGSASISLVGIIFSVIWLKITLIANRWLKHYHDKLKDIENENIAEKFRIFPQKKNIIGGSITKTAVWYSRIFIGFWIILLIIEILLHCKIISI